MAKILFMIPFEADLKSLHGLMKNAKFTPKRMDSWDKEAGFLHIGETGAIRIFRVDTPDIEEGGLEYYELFGSAKETDDISQNEVLRLYTTICDAVRETNCKLDNKFLFQVKVVEKIPAQHRTTISMPKPTA